MRRLSNALYALSVESDEGRETLGTGEEGAPPLRCVSLFLSLACCPSCLNIFSETPRSRFSAPKKKSTNFLFICLSKEEVESEPSSRELLRHLSLSFSLSLSSLPLDTACTCVPPAARRPALARGAPFSSSSSNRHRRRRRCQRGKARPPLSLGCGKASPPRASSATPWALCRLLAVLLSPLAVGALPSSSLRASPEEEGTCRRRRRFRRRVGWPPRHLRLPPADPFFSPFLVLLPLLLPSSPRGPCRQMRPPPRRRRRATAATRRRTSPPPQPSSSRPRTSRKSCCGSGTA